MTCTHKKPTYSVHAEVEVSPWGDTETQLVERGGEYTYADIGIGAFQCTQCHLVQYYTGSWRAFYETGASSVQPSQAGLSDEEIIELKRGVIPLAYPAENDDLIEFARAIIAAINAKGVK